MTSGGAQNLRRGDRVRVLESSDVDTYYLRGLEGRVIGVLHHGVIVALDSDPARLQQVIAPGGRTGPAVPNTPQRVFLFHQVVKL